MKSGVSEVIEQRGRRVITGSRGDEWEVECEVLPGLEGFLARELRRRLAGRVQGIVDSGRASLRFRFRGPLADLLTLRTAQAAFLVLEFAGQRPTALLGDQSLRRLLAAIEVVRGLHPPDAFAGFRFSAAGRDSPTFRRLAEALAEQTGLRHEPEGGELLIRVRPGGQGGWQALVRLSPRPLSTRHWRVRNLPGALNATIAAAMVELTQPRPQDRFLNLMCGSGTLIVERLLRCPAAEAVGCDDSEQALAAAQANLGAAGLGGRARLLLANATRTGLPASRFDAICVDPPYGNLVGSHRQNLLLYPALLREAARLAVPGAALIVVTHELRLLESCLRESPDWELERSVRVFQGGQRPALYLLRRGDDHPRPSPPL
ncbi:MAG TPA: methyltransferase [Candidatus Dormibacteraeota bacterium]|nr:methyltransferase [Candidatus Dormibacteraeota bacterium]